MAERAMKSPALERFGQYQQRPPRKGASQSQERDTHIPVRVGHQRTPALRSAAGVYSAALPTKPNSKLCFSSFFMPKAR